MAATSVADPVFFRNLDPDLVSSRPDEGSGDIGKNGTRSATLLVRDGSLLLVGKDSPPYRGG